MDLIAIMLKNLFHFVAGVKKTAAANRHNKTINAKKCLMMQNAICRMHRLQKCNLFVIHKKWRKHTMILKMSGILYQ